MKFNPEKHHRRSIRLKEYDYSRPGAYFITICTKHRECILGEIVEGKMVLSDAGKIVHQCWNEIPLHYPYVVLDEFVVMPDHIHGIIIINENDNIVRGNHAGAIHELPLRESNETIKYIKQRRSMILPRIIGRFKMNSAKQINLLRHTPGIAVWQRNYYDHIIRNEKELNTIREYIINNPRQWELDIDNPENKK